MSKTIEEFNNAELAKQYAKYWPKAPEIIINTIVSILEQKIPSNEWQTVVDVGCGSGQATNGIAKYFEKCYGFDGSAAQIAQALADKHLDNICYEVSECLMFCQSFDTKKYTQL